ncbi:MAG: ATP-binding protein [Clostridiales bacterium]|nr:ATP-binding protein [Clostridiales bacterium]
MNIIKGIMLLALRIVIYGIEGVGKSTIAAQFPSPLFIDTEGSTRALDVARFEPPKSWQDILDMVHYVIDHPDICKTLVLDTADWAEQMAIEWVCKKNRWDGLESAGYGKGYTYAAEEFGRLLDLLNKVVEKGINVVVIAHSQLRKVELPDEMGAYDKYELKTSKKVAPLIREWADILLFCNYKTMVVNVDGKNKAQGGQRVMFAAHTPHWDAKNRFGLPDEMPLDYGAIRHVVERTAAPQETCRDKLRRLMDEAGVTEADIQQVVAARGHYPAETPVSDYPDKFVNGWIIKYWGQIVDMIHNTAKEEVNNA